MSYYEPSSDTVTTLIVVVIFSAIVCGTFAGTVAQSKHRDPVGWFILGFLFSIIAIIAIAGMPSLPKPEPVVQPVSPVLDTGTRSEKTGWKRILWFLGID